MKTKTVIVIARTLPNRLGEPTTSYFTGEVTKQNLGPDIPGFAGIGAAALYDSVAQAVTDREERLDPSLDLVVGPVSLWMPQPGEQVVYECQSSISGAVANCRLAVVRKMTQRGYVHLERVAEAFNRSKPKQFIQGGRSNFRTYIRPASIDEVATLPAWGDMRAAQALGRELTAARRAAAEERAHA